MLSGNQVCEYTILSTSALMNPETHDFDDDVLSAAGLSRDLFGRIVMPGEIVGMLTDEVAAETGLGKIPVIAVAGHDTGSAVAAVPATDDHFAYLSSGTWSLMGVEVPSPIVTEKSFEMNFTNEGGAEGNIRFLKTSPECGCLRDAVRHGKGRPEVYISADCFNDGGRGTVQMFH